MEKKGRKDVGERLLRQENGRKRETEIKSPKKLLKIPKLLSKLPCLSHMINRI